MLVIGLFMCFLGFWVGCCISAFSSGLFLRGYLVYGLTFGKVNPNIANAENIRKKSTKDNKPVLRIAYTYVHGR